MRSSERASRYPKQKWSSTVIDFRKVEIGNLPSVPFENFRDLPAESGIYFVLGENNTILYIGQSANLKKRFAGQHHRLAALRDHSAQRIHYLACDGSITLELETDAISHFSPSLNINIRRRNEEHRHYSLSMPRDLHLEIKRVAQQNNRTITAQILHILEKELKEQDEPTQHVQ